LYEGILRHARGGSGAAAAAAGGVSMGAAVAWPCRGVWASSGENPELAGSGRGGPVGSPVAWKCRVWAGSGERGEVAAGGGDEAMVASAAEGWRAEAEPTPSSACAG
jgi:hypothetical protein